MFPLQYNTYTVYVIYNLYLIIIFCTVGLGQTDLKLKSADLKQGK